MRFFEFLFHFLEDVIDTLAKQNSRPLWVKTSTLSIVSLQPKSSPWGNNKRDNSLQHKKCGEKQEEAKTFSHSIGKYLWKNCHHSIAKENDQSVFFPFKCFAIADTFFIISILSWVLLCIEFYYICNTYLILGLSDSMVICLVNYWALFCDCLPWIAIMRPKVVKPQH